MIIEELQNTIIENLKQSAVSYFHIGIHMFLNRSSAFLSNYCFQPIVGNLSVSIELLLKSIVAKRIFSYLFVNIPEELSIYLNYPESISNGSAINRHYGNVLFSNYKTIEFDKAISYFFMMFPDKKSDYNGFLSSISQLRNKSVHNFIPNFKYFELERISYMSIKLFNDIIDMKIVEPFNIWPDEKQINYFTERYKDDQISKVKKAIENAQDNVKNGKIEAGDDFSGLLIDGFLREYQEKYIVRCPVCNNNGVCKGTVDFDHKSSFFLYFFVESFKCDSCGLSLENTDEMSLVGMETVIDMDEEEKEEYVNAAWGKFEGR